MKTHKLIKNCTFSRGLVPHILLTTSAPPTLPFIADTLIYMFTENFKSLLV